MDVVKEYEENLNKCKEYRKKYLLIDNGKEIVEIYNVKLNPNFNHYKDPYINENLKFMKLITDLDVVNQNIIESHEIWNEIKETEKNNINLYIYNAYKHKRMNKLHEYIVSDLKHYIDEVIATISIIKGFNVDNKIIVSSIGSYLSKRQPNFKELDEFIDLFEKLDNLSNSYKHSYANSDFSAIGRDEDCFVALYCKYNDFNNQPTPYVISIDYIVQEFNRFYKFTFELINKITKTV